jgi:bacterioferritin (cytochrome b1)
MRGECQRRLGPHTLSPVSQAQGHHEPVADRSLTLDELAELQHAEPVEIGELVSDIWESDEELDAFLADLRTSGDAFVA